MNPTQPSNTSATSLYISNWKDLVGIWKASKLTQLDNTVAGPRLGELHYLRGSLERRPVNQIVDYTGFFRDETNNVKYTQVEHFASEAWFENGSDNAGTLTTNYLDFQGATLQPALKLSRSFAAPPNQPFLVIRYTLTNPSSGGITYNVLDMVHLHNLDMSKQVHAWYDSTTNTMVADMTASGQLFVFLGALQAMDAHQVANDGDTNLSSITVSAWCSFDSNGTVMGNSDVRAGDVDLSFQKRVTVAPGQTETLYFYLGVCDTQNDVITAIGAVRAYSGTAWFSTTASAYNDWFTNGNKGRRVHFEDAGINTTFDRALILIKNDQNPVSGSFAATTNPIAYEYKNWVRDSAMTAIALDATGHHAEAELHWRWFAGRQSADGTWKTTYNTWDSSYVPFVEPEYDSIGTFIYGVYRHYTLTADPQFLNDLWPAVKKAADWILLNIQPNGYGKADFSIWEEDRALEHNSYTQAWYVVGLFAAQSLAEVRGDSGLADMYAGGPASILTSIQRPSTWNPPGTWNPLGYYNRAVNADNTVQPLIDSSSDVLITLGAVDHESKRSESHIATVLNACTKQKYGIARYPGDMFYYTGNWSPGGNEALGPEPSWPQMSLWIAVYDILKGNLPEALARLQWFVSIAGKGYMPPGEAVSNVTLQPLPSSMCEPLTASAFLIAALMYEGQYSVAIVPPVYNAGAAKAVTVGFALAGDAPEWTNVPYFIGPQTPVSSSPTVRIKRVYITNDDSNVYIRVDNLAGTFPKYQEQPFFALNVYSQDFSDPHTPVTNLGVTGQPLRRPMAYMVERRSNADSFQHYKASGQSWVNDRAIDSVEEPQWDPATGRMEAVIPISTLTDGDPSIGDAWADMLVVLAYHDSSNSTWRDGDSMLLHYRLSKTEQNWIYGNVEQ